MLRDDAALVDIAMAARLVAEFVMGLDRDQFLADRKTQSSAIYQLLVIGEAVKRLSSGFRTQHPTVPWALIAGMRDHLIHAYDSVDWEEVWNTIRSDVPALLANIEPLLPITPADDESRL